MDGCVLYEKPFYQKNVVSKNQNLLKYITEEITSQQNTDIFLGCGSNRQDEVTDSHNAKKNKTISFAPILQLLQQALQERNKSCNIQLEKFLMADLYSSKSNGGLKKNGESYEQILSNTAHNHSRALFDYSKITLIYTYVNLFINAQPGTENIYSIDFYDDCDAILSGLSKFFGENTDFLPAKVQLNLYQYEKGGAPTLYENKTIVGTGLVDTHYHWTVRCMAFFMKDSMSIIDELDNWNFSDLVTWSQELDKKLYKPEGISLSAEFDLNKGNKFLKFRDETILIQPNSTIINDNTYTSETELSKALTKPVFENINYEEQQEIFAELNRQYNDLCSKSNNLDVSLEDIILALEKIIKVLSDNLVILRKVTPEENSGNHKIQIEKLLNNYELIIKNSKTSLAQIKKIEKHTSSTNFIKLEEISRFSEKLSLQCYNSSADLDEIQNGLEECKKKFKELEFPKELKKSTNKKIQNFTEKYIKIEKDLDNKKSLIKAHSDLKNLKTAAKNFCDIVKHFTNEGEFTEYAGGSNNLVTKENKKIENVHLFDDNNKYLKHSYFYLIFYFTYGAVQYKTNFKTIFLVNLSIIEIREVSNLYSLLKNEIKDVELIQELLIDLKQRWEKAPKPSELNPQVDEYIKLYNKINGEIEKYQIEIDRKIQRLKLFLEIEELIEQNLNNKEPSINNIGEELSKKYPLFKDDLYTTLKKYEEIYNVYQQFQNECEKITDISKNQTCICFLESLKTKCEKISIEWHESSFDALIKFKKQTIQAIETIIEKLQLIIDIKEKNDLLLVSFEEKEINKTDKKLIEIKEKMDTFYSNINFSIRIPFLEEIKSAVENKLNSIKLFRQHQEILDKIAKTENDINKITEDLQKLVSLYKDLSVSKFSHDFASIEMWKSSEKAIQDNLSKLNTAIEISKQYKVYYQQINTANKIEDIDSLNNNLPDILNKCTNLNIDCKYTSNLKNYINEKLKSIEVIQEIFKDYKNILDSIKSDRVNGYKNISDLEEKLNSLKLKKTSLNINNPFLEGLNKKIDFLLLFFTSNNSSSFNMLLQIRNIFAERKIFLFIFDSIVDDLIDNKAINDVQKNMNTLLDKGFQENVTLHPMILSKMACELGELEKNTSKNEKEDQLKIAEKKFELTNAVENYQDRYTNKTKIIKNYKNRIAIKVENIKSAAGKFGVCSLNEEAIITQKTPTISSLEVKIHDERTASEQNKPHDFKMWLAKKTENFFGKIIFFKKEINAYHQGKFKCDQLENLLTDINAEYSQLEQLIRENKTHTTDLNKMIAPSILKESLIVNQLSKKDAEISFIAARQQLAAAKYGITAFSISRQSKLSNGDISQENSQSIHQMDVSLINNKK